MDVGGKRRIAVVLAFATMAACATRSTSPATAPSNLSGEAVAILPTTMDGDSSACRDFAARFDATFRNAVAAAGLRIVPPSEPHRLSFATKIHASSTVESEADLSVMRGNARVFAVHDSTVADSVIVRCYEPEAAAYLTNNLLHALFEDQSEAFLASIASANAPSPPPAVSASTSATPVAPVATVAAANDAGAEIDASDISSPVDGGADADVVADDGGMEGGVASIANADAGATGASARPNPMGPDEAWIGAQGFGAYVPVDDGLGAIGAFLVFELRNKIFQSQIVAGPIYASSKKSDTDLLVLAATGNYRITPFYALGLGAGIGYRWSSGKDYQDDNGYTIHNPDGNAPVGFLLINPAIFTIQNIELGATFFLGHDLVAPDNGPAIFLPGGYFFVGGMLPVGTLR